MAMRAAKRSLGGLCAFSRIIIRRSSSSSSSAGTGSGPGRGYRSVERYAAAIRETAAPEIQTDTERESLYALLKRVNASGIDLAEALKSYPGDVPVRVLASSITRGREQFAYQVYSWAKSTPGFAYPSKFILNVITALCKIKRLDQVEEVVSEMTGKADSKLEEIAWSMLYAAYLNMKDEQNAERVKTELEDRGFVLQPNAVSCLMTLADETGGTKAMLAVYKEHIAKGLLAEPHHMRQLLERLFEKDKLDEALQIFNETTEKGLEHQSLTIMLLINRLLRLDRVEEAQQVGKHLLNRDLNCDTSSINQLIKHLAARRSYEDSIKFLNIIRQKSDFTYSSLIRQLISDKEWDRAMEVVELIRKYDVRKDIGYSFLITELCNENRLTDAKKAFDVMVGAGLTPNPPLSPELPDLASIDEGGVTDAKKAFGVMDSPLSSEPPDSSTEEASIT